MFCVDGGTTADYYAVALSFLFWRYHELDSSFFLEGRRRGWQVTEELDLLLEL